MKQWSKFFLFFSMVACACSSVRAQGVAIDPLKVPLLIDYQDETQIDSRVLRECISLNTEAGASLIKNLKKIGYPVVGVSQLDTIAKGKVLDVKITDVINEGNTFIGHDSLIALKADLYVDGQKIKSRKVTERQGRASGGFKSSCAKLTDLADQTTKRLADWLDNINKP